ncbi:MAG: sensor histidine kinase [Bacillota bacterium]
MALFYHFLNSHMFLVDFISGTVFVLMGFVIVLQFIQFRHLSSFKLVKTLWLLAAFGLLHGLSRYVSLFICLQGQLMPTGVVRLLGMFNLLTSTISFSFLYAFGMELLIDTSPRYRWLRWSSLFLFGLWFSIFMLTRSGDYQQWLQYSMDWARFSLVLPGATLVSLAFTIQEKDLSSLQHPSIERCRYGAVLTFAIYGIVTGLVVPYVPHLLSFLTVVNRVLSPASIHIQVMRVLCGLGIAYFVLRIMQIFNIEYFRMLEEARRHQAILEERIRISRDLHDGVIQSLYGIGLSMESALRFLSAEPQRSSTLVTSALNQLDTTVEDIRYYIKDLATPDQESTPVEELFLKEIANFSETTGIPVNFTVDRGEAGILDNLSKINMLHILREALINVAKHARATSVTLNLNWKPGCLEVRIDDNRAGIDCGHKKRPIDGNGLRNIAQRVRKLNGIFHMSTTPGQGTSLIISIPCGGEINHGKDHQAVTGRRP